ncbi:MAG: L-threonylcarbamoyladenylate synthase [Actinomycetota bacterium]|nr:L-threonylcarbamoyladenylate synthase [Actinomycetota bacterium]
MSERYDCADTAERAAGLRAALAAVNAGELVVLPTDTVYGIGADAFTPAAVMALLAAKGRSRVLPVPVLVGSARTLEGLVDEVPAAARDLVEAFWPGGLTLVFRHTASLAWDLGETRGTVAVRMPDHAVALDLLTQTGPLAVSSANRTGLAPPTALDAAVEQLGDAVAVYLDDGPTGEALASTIVDLTADVPRLLRDGAVSVDRLRAVLPALDVGL